jgi:glycoside/pentoside/hexuronide:cation symporter, GPH family
MTAARLSARTKFSYGLGALGEGIFSRGYEYFAFLYFVQILGMDAWLGGVAMLISTLLDALSDPVVGALSDRWRSKYGRRHPFMYASAVPLAMTWYLLLSPPGGLASFELFLWFTTFSILLRMSLTLYHVPHLALGAELTSDYLERTAVVTWRILLGLLGSFGLTALFTALFFPETEAYPENGLLNPAGYPQVALWGALLMLVSIGYSAWGTRDRIPFLPSASASAQPFSVPQMVAELGVGWRNPSFRALFLGTFLFVVAFSINEIFNQFLRIYFWGLSSRQIALLIVPAGLGFLVSLRLTRFLHARFDKKPTAIYTALLPASLNGALILLQIVGALPESKSVILALLVGAALVGGICGAVALISAQSMMADVAQEIGHVSKRDMTGVLFAGVSFSQKVSSGIAHFLATVALQVIAIPPKAAPGSLAPEQIQWLGAAGLIATVFSIGATFCYLGYRIDRKRHSELTSLASGDGGALVAKPEAGAAVAPVGPGAPAKV